jgi:serine/threonine protein kinase/Tol biopolymer transport system component
VIGGRLGAYEIVAKLGEGGMGEVYRARDTTLNRDVAIKLLLPDVASDPDRLARFSREAQVLASLNHPNIAHIYGLDRPEGRDRQDGQDGKTAFIVMELVEGEELAQRIARGPMPPDEALPIARQIADALAAAHEQGIVHRDLKPANIKIRPDGTVKVLDFGLAKAIEEAGGAGGPGRSGGLENSPTLTSPAMLTGVGVILGTAAYMSPEQAKGRPADKRSDVWAFGCVLYEMLTGVRAFAGDDVADVLASVLARPINLDVLPRGIGPSIRLLLVRSLERDRAKRIADISVGRFLLEEPAEISSGSAAAPARKGRKGLFLVGSIVAAALLAVAFALRPQPPALHSASFEVDAPEKTVLVTAGRLGTSAVISPDGSHVAFTARDNTGHIQIWLRALDDVTPRPLPGTDGAVFPFWSPDSKSIAFFIAGRLQRLDITGGSPQTICPVNGSAPRGGTWNASGEIVFGTTNDELLRVSAAGGDPKPVRTRQPAASGRFPSFLPDGRRFVYSRGATTSSPGGVYLASLDDDEPKLLIAGTDTGAVYAANDYLIFARGATLFAQAVDAKTLQSRGDAHRLAEHVETGVYSGVLSFSVSRDGVLAYGTGTSRTGLLQLVWVDRDGRVIGTVGPAGSYTGIDLSPDGKRLAVHRHEGNADGSGGDIWIMDLVRSTVSRFTFDATLEQTSPIWSPDGTRIAYSSDPGRKQGVFVKSADGSSPEQLLFEREVDSGPGRLLPQSWAPDSSRIVVQNNLPQTLQDLWVLPTVGDRKPVPFAQSRFNEAYGQISPDGRWLAYQSDESGVPQIYVRPFPTGSGKWQISTNLGFLPRWRRDGKELFFMDAGAAGRMVAVAWKGDGAAPEPGPPQYLFDSGFALAPHPSSYLPYAVSSDGQRFMIPRPPATVETENTRSPIVVVEDWRTLLKK